MKTESDKNVPNLERGTGRVKHEVDDFLWSNFTPESLNELCKFIDDEERATITRELDKIRNY